MNCKLVVTIVLFVLLCDLARAASGPGVCPRAETGSTVLPPAEVKASNGQLHEAFSFKRQMDDYGLTRYCYIDQNGAEAPTLRVRPGDEVVIDLKNDLAPLADGAPGVHRHSGTECTAGPMTAFSTNLHFHGLAIPPTCHQDEVIHTSIQPSGPAFQYRFTIPTDQPPGLYWYHPHPHGYSEGQVLGGASGALIVEGVAQLKPQVAGLPERVLIFRDQLIARGRMGAKTTSGDQDDATGKNLSLNFVPMMYPLYMPAVIRVRPNQREFWRVLNASADTYFNLEMVTVKSGQRVPENLQLIATDGAPTADEVSDAPRTRILISPGARAEFIITTPPEGALSQIVSRNYDMTKNSNKVIANIISSAKSPEAGSSDSPSFKQQADWRFTSLARLRPSRIRKLYFSEDREDLRTPGKPAKYFITVEGMEPAVFDMNFKQPDITVQQGTVEDWTIENRAREAHVFHIHQLHFQLLARDGVAAEEPMLRDTIDLPYWDGKSAKYPSVKLRMDFRSPDIVGTFLFHCHILEHEDAGMMGSLEVVKPR